jgi:hypothetical protein
LRLAKFVQHQIELKLTAALLQDERVQPLTDLVGRHHASVWSKPKHRAQLG